VEQLFSALTEAVGGSPLLAAGGALAWGGLSVILSPCHLSSIALIVAFIGEANARSARRAFAPSLLFSLGILVTIAAIGIVTASLGRMLGDLGRYGSYAVALVLLVLGLHFLDLVPMPWSQGGLRPTERRGLLAAFVLGLVFGIGVGPCTFAFMAPMLGVAFKVAAGSWLLGAALLFFYGLGHCGVIVAAGTSAGWVQRYLSWNERSRGSLRLRRACGVLVLLAGLYLIYTAR
jgi:cytochrome c-type biogenesis protein